MNEPSSCTCQAAGLTPEQLDVLLARNPQLAQELAARYQQTLAEPAELDRPDDLAAVGLGPDGAPLVSGPAEPMPLARFDLSNGNRVEFVGLRGDDKEAQVGMRELGVSDRATPRTFASEVGKSALDHYLMLAPQEVPIPKMLLELNPDIDRKAFKNRTVERLEEPIEVDLDELGITPDTARAGSSAGGGPGQQYCVPGDGYHLFRNHNCETVSFPSNTWWWCDPEAHYSFRDRWTSDHKRRNSLGVTTACHGPAATLHYYKNVFGNWKHLHTFHLPSGYWQWTRYEGLSKRDRWIRHRCVTAGGSSFVRCVSFFYN
ncbi:MAG: hypothetical protein GYB54_14035 [Gammaproteobacteria bacterium]|nr:hypothetical protein [Gammaproteobacteria bacterium]